MVKIFIDPGHGGKDPGAKGNGLQEKNVVLDISQRIVNQLSNYNNVDIRMSREDDRFVSLSERARLANSWPADYFLSVHVNASGGRGFESYIWNGVVPSQTEAYQSAVHAAIVDQIAEPDRGEKRANFAVLRETSMSALLTENLFIDDPGNAEKLSDSDFLEEIAQGHTNGMVSFLNLVRSGSGGSVGGDPATSGEISTFQSTLNERYGLSIVVDNIYGPETQGALLKGLQTELNSQFNRGLVVDGIWGPNTRAAVVNVRRGAQGNITWIIQATLLGQRFSPGPIDGIYGPRTEGTVKEFQQSAGITVDGVTGTETFTGLFS